MSRFTGDPGDRWSLRAMLDELGEAARRAARPGWIWIAGLLYPSITLLPLHAGNLFGLEFGGQESTELHFGDDAETGIALASIGLVGVIFALLVLLLYSRLNAGLARLAPLSVWTQMEATSGRPGLRDCWRAGRGSTASVFGLRLAIGLLRYTVLFVMLLPALFTWGVFDSLSAQGPGAILLAVFALPALAILLIYNLLLSLLLQLALHSLVHNRRGVASALQHAWSILRQDPWAAGRALTGEILIAVISLLVGGAVNLVSALLSSTLGPFAALAVLALWIALLCFGGVVGVMRACYWATAYRALGGLSPDDGVPGLEDVLTGEALSEA
jgi:hypothetical protein